MTDIPTSTEAKRELLKLPGLTPVKACPFCGGTPSLLAVDYQDRFSTETVWSFDITCDECGGGVTNAWDLKSPIETWNKSAAPWTEWKIDLCQIESGLNALLHGADEKERDVVVLWTTQASAEGEEEPCCVDE
jgi:hypothetical protein